MVAEKDDQFSLFPVASIAEIHQTKVTLMKFAKIKADIEGYVSKNPNNNNHNLLRVKLIKSNIEKAAALIIDEDVRRLIEYRYLKGFKRKETIFRFLSIMSESTIDRNLEKGIESIASTLKLWNQFND
jgi:hypothetical protein